MAKKITKKSSKKKSRIAANKKTLLIRIGIISLAAALILFYVLSDFITKKPVEQKYMFKKEGELTFYDKENKPIVKIDIELADSEYKRQLGLMFREEMDEMQGMLFIFPAETIQSFWMRNTNISLDIIFVNSNREIVTIHKNTTPMSDRSYFSTEPAIYVVEVVAGFTDKYNIQVGDRIGWMDIRLNL